MNVQASPIQGARRPTRISVSAATLLAGIGWERYIGTGMTPDMQVLYEAARTKGQVR